MLFRSGARPTGMSGACASTAAAAAVTKGAANDMPVGLAPETEAADLFGMSVVATKPITIDKFLVGKFRQRRRSPCKTKPIPATRNSETTALGKVRGSARHPAKKPEMPAALSAA